VRTRSGDGIPNRQAATNAPATAPVPQAKVSPPPTFVGADGNPAGGVVTDEVDIGTVRSELRVEPNFTPQGRQGPLSRLPPRSPPRGNTGVDAAHRKGSDGDRDRYLQPQATGFGHPHLDPHGVHLRVNQPRSGLEAQFGSADPCKYANRAAQRAPLPHMSAPLPSELKKRQRKSAVTEDSIRMTPSAPLKAGAADPGNELVQTDSSRPPDRWSMRIKSLPLPLILAKATRSMEIASCHHVRTH